MSSAGICGNPRRVMQALWLAAGIMFTMAVVRSLGGHSTTEWVSNHVPNLPTSLGGGQQEASGDGGRVGMKEFMRTAERSWAKTVKERHELIQKDFGTVDKLPLYAAVDAHSYGRTPYTVWDLTPASYACPHEMERVGRMGDGGKWVCGMSRFEELSKTRECRIYSFGVRDESSFEEEMLSRTNCTVWAYDFSVVDFGTQLEDKNRARAHFLQAGIAGKTDTTKNPPFYSIADLMKMNGHDYVDILKMDIEFYEFEAMDGLDRDFPATDGQYPIGQFMVEIHLLHGITAARYLDWWERMENRGMRPTWTEPNLLAVTLGVGGNKDPNFAEYTLVNAHDPKSLIFDGVRA